MILQAAEPVKCLGSPCVPLVIQLEAWPKSQASHMPNATMEEWIFRNIIP